MKQTPVPECVYSHSCHDRLSVGWDEESCLICKEVNWWQRCCVLSRVTAAMESKILNGAGFNPVKCILTKRENTGTGFLRMLSSPPAGAIFFKKQLGSEIGTCKNKGFCLVSRIYENWATWTKCLDSSWAAYKTWHINYPENIVPA